MGADRTFSQMTSPRNRSGRCLGVELEPDQLSRLHVIARLQLQIDALQRDVLTLHLKRLPPLEHSHIALNPVAKCRF